MLVLKYMDLGFYLTTDCTDLTDYCPNEILRTQASNEYRFLLAKAHLYQ